MATEWRGHRKGFINFDVLKNSRKDAETQRTRKDKLKNAPGKKAFLCAAFAALRDKIKEGRDSRIYRMDRICSVFAFNNFDSNHFDFNFRTRRLIENYEYQNSESNFPAE
jgi:hypothetical protein